MEVGTWIIAVFLGIGLSAATGIRIFLPFFIIALCKYFGWLSFGSQFDWLDGTSVLVILGIATIIEILGYYIPLVDHILDVLGTPLAFIAGIVGMSSIMPEMPAYLDHILPIILGGSTAVGMNSLMGFWRVKTTASTAGVANPVFATFENISSALMTFLAFAVPLLLGIFILILLVGSIRAVKKWMRPKKRIRQTGK